jgi:hypothetical protein
MQLAAARLLRGEDDLVAEPLQHPDDRAGLVESVSPMHVAKSAMRKAQSCS